MSEEPRTPSRSEEVEAEPAIPAPASEAVAGHTLPTPSDPPGLTHGTATLTDGGQVTIPANVRRRLGLESGHRLAFTVLADGTTVMRAKTRSIGDLAGSVEPGTDRRASIDELGFG